jgi:hypothetical protein
MKENKGGPIVKPEHLQTVKELIKIKEDLRKQLAIESKERKNAKRNPGLEFNQDFADIAKEFKKK